jgi:hypothetical protein
MNSRIGSILNFSALALPYNALFTTFIISIPVKTILLFRALSFRIFRSHKIKFQIARGKISNSQLTNNFVMSPGKDMFYPNYTLFAEKLFMTDSTACPRCQGLPSLQSADTSQCWIWKEFTDIYLLSRRDSFRTYLCLTLSSQLTVREPKNIINRLLNRSTLSLVY